MDEDALMRRTQDGDTEAFGLLVKTHQRRLVRFATRLLGDAEAAEDAVQETFLRLWRLRARYRPQGCLEHLLLRIVRNICLDYARLTRPTAPLADDQPSPESLPETAAQARCLAEAVEQAVQALPEEQRAVFVLSQYEGVSYREIAEILECPEGTVASRKHLAVQSLRRRLRPWREEGEAK